MQATELIRKELLLVGGGHSHVGVIKSFGMRPEPGVRLTVVCRDVHTPYSGMLPGFIAGHYSYDESHIDLERLCQFAGARFIADDVTGLDLAGQQVTFASGRPALGYDLLSLNLGSAPDLDSVPGARAYATPVKPIAGFLARWQELLARIAAGDSETRRRIVVVGAGAGGVELSLALQHRFARSLPARQLPEITLVGASEQPLPTQPSAAQRLFRRKLSDRGISFLAASRVMRVEPSRLLIAAASQGEGVVRALDFDDLLWVTHARGPGWLAQTGLPLDDRGFIRTDASLRVTGQSKLFAAGDIAAVTEHPREKAGVFAVRQGPPLTENLRRSLRGEPLRPFKPQKHWLSLISTGDRFAVATRGRLTLAHPVLWRWKDRIDRAFMAKFGQLSWQQMPPLAASKASNDAMRCAGCGAKVPGALLDECLSMMQQRYPAIFVGTLADAQALPAPLPDLQTVDQISAVIPDPYRFARIATVHALSDIWASGSRPSSVQLLLTVPAAQGRAQRNDLLALLEGIAEELQRADVALLGGHTAEGALSVGFVVNGIAARVSGKAGARVGERLLLSKPIGSGIILAASMQLKARGRDVEAAIANMLNSNRDVARRVMALGVGAMTDVTGFGLLGHARELAVASSCSLRLDLSAVPLLPGARDYALRGVASTLIEANADYARVPNLTPAEYALFCDPQTSGGLLLTATPAVAAELVTEGLASDIGEVLAARPGQPLQITGGAAPDALNRQAPQT